MQQSPTALLRELKGSPLSVFIALLIARNENRLPVGERWIIAATGYSQNKIREGLTHLETNLFVTRSARYTGWTLTAGAYQLPLTMTVLEMGTITAPLPAGLDTTEQRESQLLTLAPTTATTTISRPKVTEEKAAAENRESQNLTLARENLTALHKAGIMGRTAEDLALLPHMTPLLIAAHHRNWLCEHKSSGILVTRLRCNDPAPAAPCSPEEEQDRKDRHRYIMGPLAQFIEH